MARTLGDAHLLARARADQGHLLTMVGRIADGLRVTEEALPALEAGGDLIALGNALSTVAFVQALRGEFERSRQSYARCFEVLERLDRPPGARAFLQATHGRLVFMGGDWQHARREIEQARALVRGSGPSWYAPYPLLEWGRLCLAEGDSQTAATSLEEASRIGACNGDLQAQRWAVQLLAERDVLAGRPGAARARLEPLLDRPGLEETDVTSLLPVLAWAHLELREVAQAADAVAQALARMRREELQAVLVDALRVQAMILTRQQRWEEATRSLEEGVALARRMPYPYAEARLLHVYGELHGQKGELEAARERLEAALALFQRLGARQDAAWVEQALTTLTQVAGPPRAAALTGGPVASGEQDGAACRLIGQRLSRADRHAWALARLRRDGALSPRLYAAALGVSLDTALRDLSALAQQGRVVAEGTTKDRRYVLRRQPG